MKLLDLNQWKRKEHFEFFSKMASPYFGVVAAVDCTKAYEKAKALNISFFAYYFHKSMQAINAIKEFKYRIIDGKVYEFDIIHAGTTIARKDGTFAFAYIPFDNDFDTFNNALKLEIKAVENSIGLRLNDDDIKKDLIRHSSLPWLSFSAILHPTNFNKEESVPKIVFGKYEEKDGKKIMPISVEAHHGLVDGFHIAQYFEKFQYLLDN